MSEHSNPKTSYKGVTVRNQPFSESFDEYLEAIYRLSLKNPGGWVKNKDISQRLGVKAPSVTSMLKKLTEAHLVDWKARSGIRLTEEGRTRGKTLVRNHIILELFLERILKIPDPAKVDQIACDIEHHMDEFLAQRFSKLLGLHIDMKNVDNFIIEDKMPSHFETQQLFTEKDVKEIIISIKSEILGSAKSCSEKELDNVVEKTIHRLNLD